MSALSDALSNGTLSFEHPLWLLALPAAPLVWLIVRRSLADFARGQLRVQALVRALVFAGVVVALAGPMSRRPARAVSAVALVDVSDSVSDGAIAFAGQTVAALTRAAAERGDPAPRVVQFAARAEEIDAKNRPLSRLPAPDGAATDLALAVGFGAGLVDATAIPRLLLISDGVPTRGDLVATSERLRDRGLPLFAFPLPADERGDVAVTGLTAPDDVRARTPFRVDVHLLADRAGEARVRLDGAGDPHVVIDEPEQTLALAPGTTTATFTVRINEPGTATLHVRATATGGDRHPENDEGVLAIATEHDPRILVLEGNSGAAGSFARALAAEHVAADVRSARGLPRDFDFGRYDLVALADVPRAQLPESTLAALDGFVRGGGGLLVAGGTQSFGPGGYMATRLEQMLPVRLDIPERREEATLALALVIDKSGSMAGPKMDLTKEAARATAEALPPADQIAVIVFDSASNPVVRLQRAANRQRILGDIARITASGGTNILSGLREAVDELLPARARKKHIILLSDGQSPYDEIPDLMDAATAARITVSAVGVGDGADQTLLKMIANRGGGRFYHTRDPASIPRIFSRETSELGDRSIVERPTAVRVAKRVAALAGVPLESAPALGGYVVTRPRAQAELILTTADGTPLFARWQLALGGVVVALAAVREAVGAGGARDHAAAGGVALPDPQRAGRRSGAPDRRRGRRRRPLHGRAGRRRPGDGGQPGTPGGAAPHAAHGGDRARALRGQLPPRRRHRRSAFLRDAVGGQGPGGRGSGSDDPALRARAAPAPADDCRGGRRGPRVAGRHGRPDRRPRRKRRSRALRHRRRPARNPPAAADAGPAGDRPAVPRRRLPAPRPTARRLIAGLID